MDPLVREWEAVGHDAVDEKSSCPALPISRSALQVVLL